MKPDYRAYWVIIAIMILLTLNVQCLGENNQTPTPLWPPITQFMTANETGFQGGFRFIGANLDPWRFITNKQEVYSQAEIEDWVANAAQYTHARVIRMHMNGGAFEPSIGTYGEASFQQLDRLLAAAAKNNVYVLISLRDYLWGPWPSDAYDPYWYLGGGAQSHPNKDTILTNGKAKAAFKNYIAYVLNRENTVTGVKYKDDPHILGWEIINEPNMVSGIKPWLAEMGGYIKSIDPNHLVGVATGDTARPEWDMGSANWHALNIAQLDFVDLHYYADLYYTSNTDYNKRFDKILQAAATLHKPIILGEFGYLNNVPRAKIINLYQSLISASFGQDVSGVMPYSWGPPGPNGWGGNGSFCMYTDDTDVCTLLKSLAP